MLRTLGENAFRIEAFVRCESLAETDQPPVRTLSGSPHVFDTGLARSTPDETIWEYARANLLTIVAADSDFLDLAQSRGTPPKIIRLENCNYRTSRVEAVLGRNAIRIAELEQTELPVLIIRNA